MLKSILIILSICMLFTLLPVSCSLPEVADIDPPIVTLAYPYPGSILNDSVQVSVGATDNKKVKSLSYTVDGIKIESASFDAPSVSKVFLLDLSPWADEQIHAFQAFAKDEEGNSGTSIQVLVTISETGDITPPVVQLTSPFAGQIVADSVLVIADANDDRIINEVRFFINGIFAASDFFYPYEYNWLVDTLTALSQHSVYARAFDGSGNSALSPAVLVTVAETKDIIPPVVQITNPFEGQNIAGSVTVIADASDDQEVSEVAFFIDGTYMASDLTSPYQYNWNVEDLELYSTHTVFARAVDGSGNITNSTQVSVNIVPALDQVPPVAQLIYPLDGQVLVGTVLVKVDASDDQELDMVEFYVDGILRSTVDADAQVSPFTFAWDTRPLVPNSQHSLYFKAIDAAANESDNAPVLFTIGQQDAEPPTLVLLYPLDGDTLSGTLTVGVDVSDNDAVSSVEYYVDGGVNGAPNYTAIAAPWNYVWNTAPWANGLLHTMYIKATDPSGNVSTVGPVTYVIR